MKTEPDTLEGDGDCYVVAAKLLDELEGAILVHGRPTLQRAPFRQYGHAWVEVGVVVVDRSNGNDVALDRRAYYSLGQIDPAECFRYSREQSHQMMLTFLHFGPWEGPEGSPPLSP